MKFIAAAKRRHFKAGIYLVRTNRHFGGGRENGYVGRSNDVDKRRLCHLGMCAHATCHPKPWTDLDPRWWSARLPWWLSWKWSQSTLEAAAIWALLPRYNVLLNTKNPRYVPPSVQRLQRAARDANRWNHRVMVKVAGGGRRALRLVGAVVILVGIIGTVWSNVS